MHGSIFVKIFLSERNTISISKFSESSLELMTVTVKVCKTCFTYLHLSIIYSEDILRLAVSSALLVLARSNFSLSTFLYTSCDEITVTKYFLLVFNYFNLAFKSTSRPKTRTHSILIFVYAFTFSTFSSAHHSMNFHHFSWFLSVTRLSV